MLDKIKGAIQSQFDQWYTNIHARESAIAPGITAETSKNERNKGREKDNNDNNDNHDNHKNNDNIDNNRHNNETFYRNDNIDKNRYDNDSQSVHSRSSTVGFDRNKDKFKTAPSENQNFDSLLSTMTSTSTIRKQSISLDADSDILAFYQAREELLKHRRVAK